MEELGAGLERESFGCINPTTSGGDAGWKRRGGRGRCKGSKRRGREGSRRKRRREKKQGRVRLGAPPRQLWGWRRLSSGRELWPQLSQK